MKCFDQITTAAGGADTVHQQITTAMSAAEQKLDEVSQSFSLEERQFDAVMEHINHANDLRDHQEFPLRGHDQSAHTDCAAHRRTGEEHNRMTIPNRIVIVKFVIIISNMKKR